MSNQYQLRTPHRMTSTADCLFEDSNNKPNANLTFTPCTRLSRMTIHSQSLGNSRFNASQYVKPPGASFTDRLLEAQREEETNSNKSTSPHPNLNMFIDNRENKISIADKSKFDSFFEEDEESEEEGDYFSSSSLYPSSSPEQNLISKQNLFDSEQEEEDDDEPMQFIEEEITAPVKKTNLFLDESDEEEIDHFDETNSWLSQIYQDDSSNSTTQSESTLEEQDNSQEDENENSPPRFWASKRDKSMISSSSSRKYSEETTTTTNERSPLREIRFEDYSSAILDDESHPKKRQVLASGKMRFIRSLSPPRFAKRKTASSPIANTTTIL